MDEAGNFNYISSPLFLIKNKENLSILTSVLHGRCLVEHQGEDSILSWFPGLNQEPDFLI